MAFCARENFPGFYCFQLFIFADFHENEMMCDNFHVGQCLIFVSGERETMQEQTFRRWANTKVKKVIY